VQVLVHQSADKGTELIRLLLKNELLSQDDEQVLFREETPGVKAFSVFSRMVGLPFLWHTFAYPIAELEIANNVSSPSCLPEIAHMHVTHTHMAPPHTHTAHAHRTPHTHTAHRTRTHRWTPSRLDRT
jgi:hypothetical protein